MTTETTALRVYSEYVGGDEMPEECREDFDEAYFGEWLTEQEFAENLVDECGLLADMPENLRYYFDYEAFARDLFINDYWSAPNPDGPGIFVYRNL